MTADQRSLVEKTINVGIREIRKMCGRERSTQDSLLRAPSGWLSHDRRECQSNRSGRDDDEFGNERGAAMSDDQAPAIVISEILMVGDTTDDRQTKSLPIISIDAYISFRFPAIVIS